MSTVPLNLVELAEQMDNAMAERQALGIINSYSIETKSEDDCIEVHQVVTPPYPIKMIKGNFTLKLGKSFSGEESA